MILKRLGPAVLAALALMVYASTASATTLETNGVKNTSGVTIHATLETGTSTLITTTSDAGFANTCDESTFHGTMSTVTGTRVGGPISTLTLSSCVESPVVVDAGGTLEIENVSGTTNGTVFSKSLKFTSPSPYGALTCTTSSSGTDLGLFTGKASGRATIEFNAVINCGFFLPSARWRAAYEVTSGPNGVTA